MNIMTQDKIADPESEYPTRYKVEWARRVLQRAGVDAPTADDVELLIREAKVLDDAMLHFRRAASSRPLFLDEANVVLAAAVTAFHGMRSRQAGSSRWQT